LVDFVFHDQHLPDQKYFYKAIEKIKEYGYQEIDQKNNLQYSFCFEYLGSVVANHVNLKDILVAWIVNLDVFSHSISKKESNRSIE